MIFPLANTGEGGCGPDGIKIPEGSNSGSKTSCTNPTGTVPTIDLYCGGSLSCVTGVANPSVVITSVPPDFLQSCLNILLSRDRLPFEVEVDFNTAETSTGNRGFCLNYHQILC